MPEVAPPDESPPRVGSRSWSENGEIGQHRVSEFREAGEGSGPGHMLMWGRITGETTTTAAKLGFLADMVPVAVCRAAGVSGAGTSLDNSLRVGHLVDTEWVLLEHEGVAADGGYGYGTVHIWSPDGTLMATGSQTAKLFSIDSFLTRNS
jgi:acyl-CoA thioesterase